MTRSCSNGPRRIPAAATYDGGPPREMLRLEQPFANHNAGHIELQSVARCRQRRTSACCTSASPTAAAAAIRSTSRRTSARRSARSCASIRWDPTARNGKYGIPAAATRSSASPARSARSTRYGVRNPQRFGWDPRNGNLFVADIGQDIVEELSLAPAGRQPGLEQVGGQLRVHQPPGGEPHQPARRSQRHLSGRRVRPARSAAPAAVRRHRRPRVSQQRRSRS